MLSPDFPGTRHPIPVVLAAAAVLVGVVLGAVGRAEAGGSERRRHAGADDFQKATLDQVVVDAQGHIGLARALETLYAGEKTPFVWCLVLDRQGRLLAGTGNEGQLLRIDPAAAKVEVLYDSDELEILSVAVSADGTVYAGSAPKGRVYRIAPDGKADVYFETGAGYVWALALDPKGTLYAGTGPEGRIYKISGPNLGQVLYDSPHPHILSLGLDGAGRLYAGSSGEGLIYRIDPAAKGGVFVLYDAPQSEVRALVVEADGTVYAAGTGGGGGGDRPAAAPPRSAPPTSSGDGASATPRPSAAPAPRQPSSGDVVFSVDPTGVVKELFRPDKGAVLALARRGTDLLVGTGDEARLYQVDLRDPERVAMLAKMKKATQVVALAVGPDGACFIGTANAGEVHRLKAEYAGAGSLVGPVLDAGFTALWGRLRWRGTVPAGGRVAVAFRSGNVAEPDDTWSPWTEELEGQPPGDDAPAAAAITCPMARYLQYRLQLMPGGPTASPIVREVVVSYLPTNRAPEVQGVAPAAARQPQPRQADDTSRNQHPARPGSPANPDGLKLTWQARDPDGDALTFTIFFRGEGETHWKQLEKDLDKPEYAWNTEAVPDGRYRIKVEASDAPDNTPERTLTGSAISDVIVVDRTAPVVTLVKMAALDATTRQLEVKAEDRTSDIVRAAWSLDGGDWVAVLSTDQIFDSPTETFLVTLKDLVPGEHTFVLRAIDAEENTGAGKVVFVVD